MTRTIRAKYSTIVLASIQKYINTERAAFVRRVANILLLLYFAVMVQAGRAVGGNYTSELYFGTPGYSLFPFPYSLPSGSPIEQVLVPLPPIQVFIYVVFVGQGVWIAWMSLGIIYIMMPLVRWVYNTKYRPNTKSTYIQPERGEKVGVLTGIIALFPVLFSVATFSLYYNLVNYGPLSLMVVLGLSTMIIGFLVFEVKNIIIQPKISKG
ncbi:MAG: hypothetical protein RTV41_10795 [Candidatus Thorarchaeota archaeon]